MTTFGGALTRAGSVIVVLICAYMNVGVTRDTGGFTFWEQLGGVGILMMGLVAGYRSIIQSSADSSSAKPANSSKIAMLEGATIIIVHLPQTLLFYLAVAPQHIAPSSLNMSLIMLGGFQVLLFFTWYVVLAHFAGQAQRWFLDASVQRWMGLVTACFLIGFGVQSLIS